MDGAHVACTHGRFRAHVRTYNALLMITNGKISVAARDLITASHLVAARKGDGCNAFVQSLSVKCYTDQKAGVSQRGIPSPSTKL